MALSQRIQSRISLKRDQLDNINSAIETLESGGQSYTIGDVTYTRASVKQLYSRANMLEREIDRLLGYRPVALGCDFSGVSR